MFSWYSEIANSKNKTQSPEATPAVYTAEMFCVGLESQVLVEAKEKTA